MSKWKPSKRRRRTDTRWRYFRSVSFPRWRFGRCKEIWAEAKNEIWGPAACPRLPKHQGGGRRLWWVFPPWSRENHFGHRESLFSRHLKELREKLLPPNQPFWDLCKAFHFWRQSQFPHFWFVHRTSAVHRATVGKCAKVGLRNIFSFHKIFFSEFSRVCCKICQWLPKLKSNSSITLEPNQITCYFSKYAKGECCPNHKSTLNAKTGENFNQISIKLHHRKVSAGHHLCRWAQNLIIIKQ